MTTNDDFLHQVYKSLLNRAPDEIGYKHWINELNSKTITHIELIKKFVSSDEFQSGAKEQDAYIELIKKFVSSNEFLQIQKIIKELSQDRNKNLKIRYSKISVNFTNNLDGGGVLNEPDFVVVVKKLTGKVSRICEFGAGPAFIGFSLLSNGLCDSLCLIDINPEAVKICKKTIQENKLESKVSVYLSDGLSNIPSSEKWDLVVSSPPQHPTDKGWQPNDVLRAVDKDWKLHQQFYANIKKFLKPNGSILFSEDNQNSTPSLWSEMISKNGLQMIDAFWYRQQPLPPYRHKDQMKHFPFYFVWSKIKNDTNFMNNQQNKFTSLLQ